uniref:uncharacterized protein LOC107434667 n=1 Tax=Ziziphus jujuba TaxID=326968 RepID=A0A6P4AZL2_ZIZJJ
MRLKLETGKQSKKFAVIFIRTCYRSVCNHPFLVGILFCLIILYRSFPFWFSLLVSASPVLVCTAILLGTLLSFGQPNIPEIGKEEHLSHDIASLRAGVSENDTVVVERDESFVVGKYEGKKSDDEVEKSIEESSSLVDKVSKVEDDHLPIADENPHEIHTEKRLIEEVERESSGLELESNRGVDEGKAGIEGTLRDGKAYGDHFSLVQEIEADNSSGVSVKDQKEDHLYSSLVNGGGDENYNDDVDDDNDDVSSDSESDRAESSSPDASMADIMPMLDELHPLLPRESPRPRPMSPDESDAVSERSHRSNDDSGESDEDSEIQGEVEGDGEEEAQGGKEDESKSAIKWTEDDQKNLMDLGTSELERNQRLENLIARRRARKSFKMMAEKNLIDFESADLPFNVPPISIARRNPFDLPYDSYDNMGLPPIPGSAPSILLPRRNPFDIPYDSNEEKPDLKGDGFAQEFTTDPPQKDIFFRRHESFSLGPSSLGFVKHDKQDIKWRPVFVPERLAAEGTSYSSFTRQSSEVSDSKLSSVPDSESVSSGADPDEKILGEQDFSKEKEMISNLYQASNLVEHGGQSSEGVASAGMVQTEKRDVQHAEFEVTLGQEEIHNEMEVENYNETEVENKSETESSSSETEEEVNDVELNTSEIHLETEPVEEESSGGSSLSSLSEVDEKISIVKNDDGSSSLEASGNHINKSVDSPQPSFEESKLQLMSEVVDENLHVEPVYDLSPQASGKLLSLTSISNDTQVEILEMVKPPASENRAVFVEDEESKVHGGESIENDSSHHEEMNAASTSLHAVDGVAFGSEQVIETSENVSRAGSLECSPTSDDQNRSVVPEPVFGDVDSSSSSSGIRSIEEGKRNQEESDLYDPYDARSSSFDVEPITVHQDEDNNSVASGDQISPDKTTFSRQEEEQFVVEHSSVPDLSTSETGVLKEPKVLQEETIHLYEDQVHSYSSSGKVSIEEDTYKYGISHPEKDQVQSSSIQSKMQVGSTPDLSVPLVIPEGEQASVVLEQVKEVDPSLSPSEKDLVKEDSLNKQETVLVERGELSISSSDEKIDASLPQGSELKAASESEKELSWSDKAIVEPHFDDQSILHEPAAVTAVFKEDSSTVSNDHDPDEETVTNLSPDTSDSVPIPSESPEHKSTTGEIDLKTSFLDKEDSSRVSEHLDFQPEAHVQEENFNEVDEIKDIDEGLLSELDTVGDFSVKEVGKPLHDELTQQEAVTESTNLVMLPDDANLTQTNGELPVLEAKSIVDIDLAFKQLHEGVDVEEVILPSVVESTDLGMLPDDSNLSQTKGDLPVLEAKSIVDIDLAFKQLHEGVDVEEVILPSVVESTDLGMLPDDSNLSQTKGDLPVLEAKSIVDIDLAFKQLHEGVDVEEVILPSVVESTDLGMLPDDSNLSQTKGDLPVLEAKSIVDIDLAFKQLHEGVDVEEVILPSVVESTDLGMLPDDSNLSQTKGDLPVLEAKSIVDIDLAFKQLHEGVDVEKVILPSMVEDQLVKEELKDPNESTSDLQVVEAKSLEDIFTALKQVSEVDAGELPIKDASAAEEKEVGSIKDIESGSKDKESGTDELKHDIHETLENPDSSISNKSKTRKVKSGSSSSSSSSSSDSE